MPQDYDLKGLVEKISQLKAMATDLKVHAGGIQAVERNTDRMLACIRLLELDFSDLIDIMDENVLKHAGV